MTDNVMLVIYSFFASFGLGIVFRIEKKLLLYAGLGGALTRIVYLYLLSTVSESFIYSFLAALCASLYAEFMAWYKKRPSTVFLYPSIIPLIPGSLLYHTVVGILLKDTEKMMANGEQCIHALVGLGIGFVIASMVVHYKRNYLHLRKLRVLKRVIPKKLRR